jgi:hypothetical protein
MAYRKGSTMSDTEAEKAPDFDEVMRTARRWYYSEIRDLANEAIKECLSKRGCPDGDTDERREWIDNWVSETTDGHEFVIYTAKAGMALAASDCDTAYEDSQGDGEAATAEVRACYAMRADVWQLLEARSDEWEASEESEEDDS